MFQATDILFLYVETPLHAGTGSGLGVVDLPIQRERVTGYPLVQASGIKGVLRGLAERANDAKPEEVITAFGPETANASDHAGAISPGDARLLLFPVRSLLGIFAWTTSRHALSRFMRDAKLAGLDLAWDIPELPDEKALVCKPNEISADGQVILEEFSFPVEANEKVNIIAEWLADHALPTGEEYAYWRQALRKRLIILPEDDFREFTRFSTEVVTRVQLDNEKKTVQTGALWTEENLPTDTLLYVPVYATKPRNSQSPEGLNSAKKVLEFVQEIAKGRAQIGGNETIGRGIVALRWAESNHKEASDE